MVKRFWNRVDKKDVNDCWEWTGALRAGYGAFKLDGKVCSAHRVAWELTSGKIQGGLWVLHHCDNPVCVNPAHLFLGSQSDNMVDAYKKGRCTVPYCCGTDIHTAKLSKPDVLIIRARFAKGETQTLIARDFPVSRRQIGAIVHRESWKHI